MFFLMRSLHRQAEQENAVEVAKQQEEPVEGEYWEKTEQNLEAVEQLQTNLE